MKLQPRTITGLVAIAIFVTIGLGWWENLQWSSQKTPAAAESQTRRIKSSPTPHKSEPIAAASKAPALPANSVDVCGVGRVAVDDPEARKVNAELDARKAKDISRWRTALLNSSDVRARAVGLFIDDRMDAASFGKTPSQQGLESLVQLVNETNDPAVYAIALSACDAVKTPVPGGSCERISRKNWSKLEPGNAAPWLELAGTAHAANDTEAENAAFAQAVKAGKINAYNWSLFGFAEADLPADMDPFERSQLSIWMIGIEAAMYSPQMPTSVASKHCSADNVKNDSVRSQCGQLAELLVKQGTTLIDFAIGTSIGARTGWPVARVAALKEENEALQGVWMLSEPDPGSDQSEFSCEVAARRNHILHERAQLGEIAAAREAISLSGRTNAELAQSYQDYLKKLMRKAEQINGNGQ